MGPVRSRRQRQRQQRRLVVAPREQPPRMQRHRRDHVRRGDQVRAAAQQQVGQTRRSLRAVAVLEREN